MRSDTTSQQVFVTLLKILGDNLRDISCNDVLWRLLFDNSLYLWSLENTYKSYNGNPELFCKLYLFNDYHPSIIIPISTLGSSTTITTLKYIIGSSISPFESTSKIPPKS